MVLKLVGMGFYFSENAYIKDGWNILDFVSVAVLLRLQFPFASAGFINSSSRGLVGYRLPFLYPHLLIELAQLLTRYFDIQIIFKKTDALLQSQTGMFLKRVLVGGVE